MLLWHMGNDVLSAEDFVQVFQESKVRVLLIKEEDIQAMKSSLSDQVPGIPHNMKIKQITYSKELRQKISLGNLGCFDCDFDSICSHFPSIKSSFDFNVVPVKPNSSYGTDNVSSWRRLRSEVEKT
ncbi:unnamed protein product [Larinioides sclopetarius]|uniref:Uncharacterized protein n=1 Tax=Larinioides sclopetarius TaxID=280406 RepID=A0AAV1Z1C4_9ARAC